MVNLETITKKIVTYGLATVLTLGLAGCDDKQTSECKKACKTNYLFNLSYHHVEMNRLKHENRLSGLEQWALYKKGDKNLYAHYKLCLEKCEKK